MRPGSVCHPPLPSTLRPVVAAVALACGASASVAGGQTPPAPLALQASPWLPEPLPAQPAAASQAAATQLDADRIEGQLDSSLTASGNAQLRQPGMVAKADWLHYDQFRHMLLARGHARVNRMGNVFASDEMALQLDAYSGYFNHVYYRMLRNGGHGHAERVDVLDAHRSVAHNAIYTTCLCSARDAAMDSTPSAASASSTASPAAVPASGSTIAAHPAHSPERAPDSAATPEHSPRASPDWYIKARTLMLDTERNEGRVQGGALVFKGVPILPLPSGVGFPISDERRSGLLPPVVSYNSSDGLRYTQPYYFNIAPNRDATVAPSIYTARGVALGGQFRYLEQNYAGSQSLDFMPEDRRRDRKRWSYHAQHQHTIHTGWPAVGALQFQANIRRVSDDDYWRDFSSLTDTTSLTQRLLSSDARLSWQRGRWSAYLYAQKWQTLQQDAPNNIVPPFDRLPQLHASYRQPRFNGWDYALDLDATRFSSDERLTQHPNGLRTYARGRVSYPLLYSWGYITPALQLQAAHYHTQSPLRDGTRSASVVVPTLTLDGSVVFERDSTLRGRAVTQTLEPRLFYAFTPYRHQNHLPVYDSALKDFNTASIFSANPFTGNDRVADINALTLGGTSRIYDKGTGAELARVSAAARRQFTTRRVMLSAADSPQTSSFSDILLDASVHWSPRWYTRAAVDFDPTNKRTQSRSLEVGYNPSLYRTVTLNYHAQRGGSEQVGLGWQWPISSLWDKHPQRAGRWYSVGRLYYSLHENTALTPAIGRGFVDALLGLEYTTCCWTARIGYRRQQTQVAPTQYDNQFMLQLEFTGLSRVGSGVLQTFREHVPNYTPLHERARARSRFENYD